MWGLIFGCVLLFAVACFVYLISRFYKFRFMRKITMNKKFLTILLSIIIILVMFTVLTITMNMMNSIIVLMHLVVIWLIVDFIFFIIKKCRKKPFKFYFQGIIAMVLTAVYLTFGWYFAHNVVMKNYKFYGDRRGEFSRGINEDPADVRKAGYYHGVSHGASKMDLLDYYYPEDTQLMYFKKHEQYKEEQEGGLNKRNDTSKEDMIQSCKALSKFKTKYGVYFVYGNHDKGYYGKEYRGYDGNDLAKELRKNGVKVLEDESVLLNNKFYIVGRQDYSEVEKGGTRASAKDLVKNLDCNKYIIMLDHQPNHYKEEKNANVDLVLSGHTHGGQLIPITYSGEWLGMNDKTYGYEREKNTDFIVSSGIGDWSIKFKTGCVAEYVVVDINK